MKAEHWQVMRLGHSLLRIFVRQNRRASCVQRRVVVGVIEVPVRINHVFQRRTAQSIQRLFELWPRRRKESIHHELAVRSGQYHHVSARSAEQREIVKELLRLDGNSANLCAHARRVAAVWRLRGGAENRRWKKLRQE